MYLKTIADSIGIRTQRLLHKVQKLGIHVQTEGAMQAISKHDARLLILSYVETNKSSERTKMKANDLLKRQYLLDKLPAPPSDISSENNKKPIVRGYKGGLKQNHAQRGFANFLKKMVQSSINFLEGTHFKFLALAVAIWVQMHHSADWYHRILPNKNSTWYSSYAYAFMVDLFIIVVTLEGKTRIAKTFALLTFFANILYFQFWVGFDGTPQSYTNAISSILISGMMAYIIYVYTELFVKHTVAGSSV